MKNAKGIHIYHAVKRESNLLSVVLNSLLVWFLAAAWWAGLFSVYKVELDKRSLYFLLYMFALLLAAVWSTRVKRYIIPPALLIIGVIIWKYHMVAVAALNRLANVWIKLHNDNKEGLMLYDELGITLNQMAIAAAILTIPLLVIWTIVIWSGQGKLAAGLLMLLPVIAAAAAGKLPAGSSIWLLVFAAGIYFAAAGGTSGRNVLGRGFSAAVLLGALIFLSSGAGVQIEKRKSLDDSSYDKIRAALEVNIVQRLQQSDKKERNAEDEENASVEDTSVTDTAQTGKESTASSKPQGFLVKNGISDLKTLARYQPQTAAVDGLKLERAEKPQATVYYSVSCGGNYIDGSWEVSAVDQQVRNEYYQYPGSLTRLKALCDEQGRLSLEDTEAFIRQEFEENTVYDYHPGRTPDDQDFAEYFLFDNKKGFCVHFATTAVLMYRMYGYPARYVEGYAVPASAFKKQDNGMFAAQVTADMGHAWGEVYENGWQLKEHTLSYEGVDITQQKPAAHTKKTAKGYETTVMKIAYAIAAFGLVILVITIQHRIRRRLKYRSFQQSGKENRFLKIYLSIYEIGVFQGMKRKDPLISESFDGLKEHFDEISEVEWEWIRETVLSSTFYERIPDKLECEKLLEIYRTISKSAMEELNCFQRIKYRCWLCLD